jgi:hypothetical protein
MHEYAPMTAIQPLDHLMPQCFESTGILKKFASAVPQAKRACKAPNTLKVYGK